MRSAYLAGPEVFFSDPAGAGAAKKAVCAEFGFTGLYPLDNDLAARPGETAQALSHRIFAANRALMQQADFGVFNLTPFRGPSADAGTVFELGFMAALGKPVFGYSNLAGDYRDRVAPDGFSVEDFGNADNLMIDAALALTGRPLVRMDVTPLWGGLTAFRLCLQMASAEIS